MVGNWAFGYMQGNITQIYTNHFLMARLKDKSAQEIKQAFPYLNSRAKSSVTKRREPNMSPGMRDEARQDP